MANVQYLYNSQKNKMKKLQKISSYILTTVLVMLISQYPVLAADDSLNQDSSLSGIQVIGGFAILMLVILLPLLKKEKKKESF
jgi:hypothetical protein